MKPEQIYQGLKELADKLEITVKEENFNKAGIHVNSGLCKVKGKTYFIMDKHKKVKEKIDILSETLSRMKHEDIYVVPAIREILTKPVFSATSHPDEE
jgi:hypothetical protein